MYDYEFQVTDAGVLGTMPSGEEREFPTEDDYYQAYCDEENEIIDNLYELNNGYRIEDDFNSWMEYA